MSPFWAAGLRRLRHAIASYVLPAALVLAAVHVWQTKDLIPNGERLPAHAWDLPRIAGDLPPADRTPAKRLVYVFAPWCGVCHANVDNLSWLARLTDPARVGIILVAMDYGSESEVREFLARHTVNFPVLLGDAPTGQAFRVSAYPSYYVVGPQGEVLAKAVGYSPTLGMWLRLLWA